MKEVWKIIDGCTDYQISNYGRVKSLKFDKERILKDRLNNGGYPIINLCFKKNQITKTVHRLVAYAFLSNIDNKPEVNHKDGNKQNNHVDNLEWCTSLENTLHACKNELVNNIGEKHYNSKLTENDVLTIHGLYLSGMKQKEIAKIYNTNQTNVSLIVIGKTWKYLL